MSTSVFCIASSANQAILIIDRLKAVGFTSNDISVLMPDKSGSRDFAHEHNTKAPEGAVAGVGAGAALGGALGWLTGIGALTIPGIGPFLAAGPIMVALSGSALVGALGGVTGALIGMGIPEYEARRFEGKIQGGNVLLSVHSVDSEEISRAKSIFQDAGAEDIAASGEVAAAIH